MGRERRFFVGNGNSTRWYCVFAHVPDTMIVSIWARRSTLTRGGLSPLLSMITSLNVKRASSSAVRLSRQRGKPTWRNSADREMPKVIASGNSSLRNDCRSAKTHRPGERHGSLYGHKAVARLRQLNPTLRVSTLKDVLGPYRRAEDLSRYKEGLRQAGLPE